MGTGSKKKTLRFKSLLKKTGRFILVLFLFHFVYVIFLRWFPPPVTFTMLENKLSGNKILYKPIRKNEMGRNIQLAVIASEDQRFTEHYGVDSKAIKSALEHNKKGGNLMGGSTISQQTAKNVFLWQGRSWLRKGLELYCTFIIEICWRKGKIIEHYLNVAEMGIGVYGIEKAAEYYYQKKPDKLTKSEAAWIASILPNPKKYDPKNPDQKLVKKHRWILKQMNNLEGDKDIQEMIK